MRSSSLRGAIWLRMEGTLPVTAQSPSDTTSLLRLRMVCTFSRSSCELTASAPGSQARHFGVALDHFLHGESFFGERAGGAHLDALAAIGATPRLAPRLVHVANHHGADAARADVPDVRAFHLGADPHAARAEDAAVVIEHVALVRYVHRQLGERVSITHAVSCARAACG